MGLLEFCAGLDKFMGMLGRLIFVGFTLSPVVLVMYLLFLLMFD